MLVNKKNGGYEKYVGGNKNWIAATNNIEINEDEVHIFRCISRADPETINDLKNLLSTDERRRADNFFFIKDHDRFVINRGVLRLILSQFVDMPATDILIEYSYYGKPFIRDNFKSPLIKFNISHSGSVILLAFIIGRNIGVDVEKIKEEYPGLEIAKKFFSRNEAFILNELPPEVQKKAFYDCWTRKEAYIKAKGKGLSLNLNSFDVSLKPGYPAKLLSVRDDPSELYRWVMKDIKVRDGYSAALVVEGEVEKVFCWDYSSMLIQKPWKARMVKKYSY